MRALRSALVLALAGCRPAVESGECFSESELAQATPLQGESIGWSHVEGFAPTLAIQIESASALEDFETGYGLELGADGVDFDTQQILGASAHRASTCGLRLLSESLVTIDGAAHLQLEVEDSSGSCRAVCDMSQSITRFYAIPAGQATACARRFDACN